MLSRFLKKSVAARAGTKVAVGFDTGFFVNFLSGADKAAKIWKERIRSGETEGIVSCITLYELYKLALKSRLNKEKTETFLKDLPEICTLIWLDEVLVQKAAYLSHQLNLAMADALILQSLVTGGAKTIYTTDSDLVKYRAGPKIVTL
jgi:predicted nucleic acid-binding protein